MNSTYIRLCWLGAGFFATWCQAASVPASSQIKAVTVYTDRAIITRSARVDLPAGNTEILLENLPVTLLDDSLQVSGRGATGVTILDVASRPQFIAATPNARIKGLEDQIRAEEKKLRVLNDRNTIIEQQRGLISRIEGAVASVPGKDSPAIKPTFDDWQKLVGFAEENRNRYAAEQQTLDQQKRDLQGAIDALVAQLNELRGNASAGHGHKTVAVRVAAAQPGALELALLYSVPGASWSPSYDARLRAEDRTIELSYFGIVRQSTGEDWQDILLTLSTARPGLGGSAPELSPWILDVTRPMPVDAIVMARAAAEAKRERPVRTMAAPAASAADQVANDLAAPTETATATVGQAATSASFTIQTPAVVPSDNTPQKVGIATAKLATILEYQATPKLAEIAFLTAEVTNTTEYPLLGGKLNTFLGESYVASGSLKTVMPSEKFTLSLGADEGISIKRRLVNRFAEDTGLTSNGRRVTYEYSITITNNKRTPERIVFREAVPISRFEKIVVNQLIPAERDIGTAEKPKEVTREAEGKLVWRLSLKSGEKREITLKFNVEHPRDVVVSGLE